MFGSLVPKGNRPVDWCFASSVLEAAGCLGFLSSVGAMTKLSACFSSVGSTRYSDIIDYSSCVKSSRKSKLRNRLTLWPYPPKRLGSFSPKSSPWLLSASLLRVCVESMIFYRTWVCSSFYMTEKIRLPFGSSPGPFYCKPLAFKIFLPILPSY